MPTTATEWLANNPGSLDQLDELLREADVPIEIWTEIPLWMKQEIAAQLAVSFSQPYWEDIARTTGGDAAKAIQQGLDNGWSIRKIADEMKDSLGDGKYAKRRALNIARTESGHALNGARKASMTRLMVDMGPEIPMRPEWLSVLAATTRDTHAILDGVPADDEGMWTLAGIRVPWPAYYALPPQERCNCMCTIVMSFGIKDSEAHRLIQEYYDRELAL